jgi:hypothetical protein
MKNKRVIILVAVLAFLAGVLILREILFRPGEKLALVTTEPAIYQTNVDPNLEKISLQFNQNVEGFDFSLSTFPDFPCQSQTEADWLIITPGKPLAGEKKYLVEVSTDSFYFPLEFTTAPTKFDNDLAPEQERGLGDPKAEEEIAKTVLADYPLFYQTPKKTDSWQADYSQKKELTVFYQSSQNLEIIQEEVFAWMASENVDPETHNFKWQPVAQEKN